jgi:SpoVK/Ycf46/Vps4 family AAA+-type ATPase
VTYDLIKFIDDSQSRPLISRCLKLDDRIVNFLLEQDLLDSEVASFAKIITPTRDWSSLLMEEPANEGLVRLAENFFNKGQQENIVFYLKGPYGTGKKTTAEAFCNQLGVPMIIVDMIELLNIDSQMKVEEVVKRLFREALLRPAVIYLEHFDQLIADNAREIHIQNAIVRAMEEFSFITFLAGEKSWAPVPRLKKYPVIKVELSIPSFQLRKRLWEMSLNNGCPLSSRVNIDEIANKFQFTGGQIRDAAAEAKQCAAMCGTLDKEGLTMADLYSGAHAQSNHNLSKMARKVTPNYTWSDIVLPPDKLQQLREMCNYVKYRHLVYGEWGFGDKISLGKGLNILFSGSSGTGKTMASEIIATELKLDFYKIDLSCVVSKYIGETEKNLAVIFKEAEAANAVLFFDEADALFGKRSEVKDSHDRYANIEINYLLQKMEEHEGIVILASNFRKNIDQAFTRRMHFSLDFPFPDEKYRLHIWRKIFPEKTPKTEDIDFELMARQFKISGGNIKNVALNAAFLAADDDMLSLENQKKGGQQGTGRKVGMKHIIFAAKREYQKMGKLCDKDNFGKYYELVKQRERG